MINKLGEAATYLTDKHAASMTLRDHFAGLAMQILGQWVGKGYGEKNLAKDAYVIADAMLAEREKNCEP